MCIAISVFLVLLYFCYSAISVFYPSFSDNITPFKFDPRLKPHHKGRQFNLIIFMFCFWIVDGNLNFTKWKKKFGKMDIISKLKKKTRMENKNWPSERDKSCLYPSLWLGGARSLWHHRNPYQVGFVSCFKVVTIQAADTWLIKCLNRPNQVLKALCT